MTNPNDIQVGGDHYKSSKGLQHWDVMTDFGDVWFIGNCTKYASRWRKKNGLQDLEKAGHYLAKFQEGVNSGTIVPTVAPRFTPERFTQFVKDNDIGAAELPFCRRIFFWRTSADLAAARTALDALIAEAKANAA